MSPLEALAGKDDGSTSTPIVTITEAALAKLLELRADEPDDDQLGLRVEVTSGPGEEFRYDLSFDEYLKAAFADEVRTSTGEERRTTCRLPFSVTSTVWVVARRTITRAPGFRLVRLPFMAVSCETVRP